MPVANLPLLSIITINLNNASGVLKTCASLLRIIDDPDVEMIFVDGLSSDESKACASSFYRDELIICENDTGIYDAMNKGLLIAQGKWCLWINSGDELNPQLDVS